MVSMIEKKDKIIKDTGYFLKAVRVSKSISGTELGKLLNLSQQQISRYENGKCRISIDTLYDFLNALDTDWSDYYYSVIAGKHSCKY